MASGGSGFEPLSHLHALSKDASVHSQPTGPRSPENLHQPCPSFIIQENQGYKKCRSDRHNLHAASGCAGILSHREA